MLSAWFPHFPSLVLVVTIAIVLLAGVAANALAARLRIPSLLLLLGAGLVLGPGVLGWVDPGVLGVGLRALVAIAVAVIVFEGALLIDARQLRHASGSVLALATFGAGVTFLASATLAHAVAGLPWRIALLYGAIVCVTGPTVIGPILRRLPLGYRLKTVLEAEAILVDAVGVLLTAAVFSYMTGASHGLVGGILQMASNLAVGVLVGGSMALALKLTLGYRWIPRDTSRVAVLGGVVACYALAEALAHESGIAAVAALGFLAGQLRLPEEEAIRRFKGDLSQVALSLVFILLAASSSPARLLALGWRGALTVLAVMLLVRPLAVLVSTWGGALTWPERAFVAWLGPKGIVAVSLASLMAIELEAWGIEGAQALEGLVLLTVITTVMVQGGGAGWMAERLKLVPEKILVVGGDAMAVRLVRHLAESGEAVIVLDREEVAGLGGLAWQTLRGDATEERFLRRAGLAGCRSAVVATPSDKANMLIAQAMRRQVAELRIVTRVNEDQNLATFQEAGFEPMAVNDAAAMTLSAWVTRPTLLPLLGGSAEGDRLDEVAFDNPGLEGKPLRELDLPRECLVALIKRDGRVLVPDGETRLARGDRLTIVGLGEAVDQARGRLERSS